MNAYLKNSVFGLSLLALSSVAATGVYASDAEDERSSPTLPLSQISSTSSADESGDDEFVELPITASSQQDGEYEDLRSKYDAMAREHKLMNECAETSVVTDLVNIFTTGLKGYLVLNEIQRDTDAVYNKVGALIDTPVPDEKSPKPASAQQIVKDVESLTGNIEKNASTLSNNADSVMPAIARMSYRVRAGVKFAADKFNEARVSYYPSSVQYPTEANTKVTEVEEDDFVLVEDEDKNVN